MKRKLVHIFTVICLLTAVSLPAAAQSVDALKKQRKEIEGRIKETDKLLKQTQKNEKSSLNKLNVLKKHLKERKSLITNYNTEISVLDRNITSLTSQKIKLEEELKKLKDDYARLIRKSQSNRNSYSKMMFLLSAKNFDQSLRRVRYLQEFSEYKKGQVRQIEKVQQLINLKADSLDKNKLAKVEALKAKEVEAAKLQKDEKSEKVFLAGLQKEEKKLLEQYKNHQKRRDQIDRRIQLAIEEEVRKAEARRRAEEARRKAAEEKRRLAEIEAKKKLEEKKLAEARAAQKAGTSTPAKTTEVAQNQPATKTETPKQEAKPTISTPTVREPVSRETREEQLLTGNFASNRGRLPWPVDRGYISGKFGVHPHPELKHIQVNNKGTFFRAPAGTNARAVFEGEVSLVFELPGSGRAVIVTHGNYRSIYGNLSQVYVQKGQRVSAKDTLGKIYTDSESGQAELLFQIYNERTMLNPESWITR